MRFFVTFEGGDGAGKSTLIAKVGEALAQRGYSLCQTRAPGATETGQAIREILLHQPRPIHPRCELFLFLADRAEHVEKVIKPALAAGQIVLCDRFNDSTLAYQAGARGLSYETVRTLCTVASDGLEPDLTLYLDIDPEVALKRIASNRDRMEQEKMDFHHRIREAFQEIAREEPQRFQMLNATQSPEEVFKSAMEMIDASL